MAMQINGSYDQLRSSYEENVKEKQAAKMAEKAKETNKETEIKNSGKLSEPHDEYISSERSEKKPTGLYWISQDENGNRKIVFDDPNKTSHLDKKEASTDEAHSKEATDNKASKEGVNNSKKPEEKCTTNTDKVDREIKKLKEEKQQLEQQLQSASGDENTIHKLERRLAQVEQELSQKDNDTYRRSNASVSE